MHSKAIAVFSAIAVCMGAFACVLSSDGSDAWSAGAGNTVSFDSDYYEFEGTDADISERCSTGTVWGVRQNLYDPGHPDPPQTVYRLPQWASGTVEYDITVMDSGGVDVLYEDSDSAAVTGSYGLSRDRPITQKVDLSLWINGNLGTRTLYVAYGTQFDTVVSCGYSTHKVTVSGSNTGLSVAEDSYGGRVTGTLRGNATISANGTWATGESGVATYSIVCVSSEVTHAVSYSANGGTGTTATTAVTDVNAGSTDVTLAACGFTKAGYEFAGWKIGSTIYQPGQTVSVAANTTLNAVAQWTPVQVRITSSGDDADVVVGNSFSREVVVTPAGASITLDGPSWMSLSGSTLVGTPTSSGDYSVTVGATNGATSDSQSYSVRVVNRLAFESVPTGAILSSPVV